MASFVMMERPAAGTRDFEAVRDGFHWLALIFPLLWFLFHRMWIEAAATFLLGLGIGLLIETAGLPWLWPLSLFIPLFAGFEASELRLASMRRAGWREWGVVAARDRETAEERYLEEAAAGGRAAAEAPAFAEAAPLAAPRPSAGPALGFFSYPGGR